MSNHLDYPNSFVEGERPSGARALELVRSARERTITDEELLELTLFIQDHEHTGASYLELWNYVQKLEGQISQIVSLSDTKDKLFEAIIEKCETQIKTYEKHVDATTKKIKELNSQSRLPF